MILDAYLSQDHFDDRDGSCPLIALPSDVGRGSESVKGAFRQVLAMMVDTFAGNLGPGPGSSRERALALTAMMVGGMVARACAVDDAMLAGELRQTAHGAQAIAMAGWEIRGMTDKDALLDQKEVARFAALAEEWWNPAGPLAQLHRLNPLRG